MKDTSDLKGRATTPPESFATGTRATLAAAVAERIDGAPVGRLQILAIVLCGLLCIVDGFDLASIALVVPVMAKDWQVPAAAFGLPLAGAMAGLGIGNGMGGSLGDRYGRKPFIIASGAIVCVGSIAVLAVRDTTALAALRLVTGLGFGFVMPNVNALIGDLLPRRRRVLSMTILSCAICAGGMVAGLVAPAVIARYHWQGMFVVGALLPLLAAMVMMFALPESPTFLAGAHGNEPRLRTLLARLGIDRDNVAGARQASGTATLPVARLVHAPYTARTVFFAGGWFLAGFTFYLLTNWLPTLMVAADFGIDRASQSVSLVFGGAIAGGLILGWSVDHSQERWSFVLALAFGLAALVFIGFAAMPVSFGLWSAVFLVVGFLLGGALFTLPGSGARLYPTEMLASGIGWVGAFSRIGSTLGPTFGGYLLARGLSPAEILNLLAAPAAACALGVAALQRANRRASISRTFRDASVPDHRAGASSTSNELGTESHV